MSYVKIPSSKNQGTLAISKEVFESIAQRAVGKVSGVSVKEHKKSFFSLTKPISVKLSPDGKVSVSVIVSVKQGNDVTKVCSAIQSQICEDISLMAERVPVKVDIKVDKIS